MPLGPSDPAFLQARAGIARSGAVRSGYYTPNLMASINGVDVSSSIMRRSMRVHYELNEAPDTAFFTLKPGASSLSAGMPVTIGIGALSHYIFAGQIARATHRRRVQPTATLQAPYIDVECIDWTDLFDQQPVTGEFSGTTVVALAAYLIANYAPTFTYRHLDLSLTTAIDNIAFTNEKLSTCLRRLITRNGGGGFYIDPQKDVHLFGPSGESGLTNPVTLTDSTAQLYGYAFTEDRTQLRNAIIVEGPRTRLLRAIPANSLTGFQIPVEDASRFSGVEAVRIGSKLVLASSPAAQVPVLNGNRLGGKLTSDAAVGATSLSVDNRDWVDDVPGGIPSAFIQFGDQILQVSTVTGAGPYTVTLGSSILGAGSDALQTPLASGADFTAVDAISITTNAVEVILAVDAEVVGRITEEDATSIATAATRDGVGDGRHYHTISDGRLTVTGMIARAQAELALFKDPLITDAVDTRDMNAYPGRILTTNFTVWDTAFNGSRMITAVDLTFPSPDRPPRRQVTASDVRLAEMSDQALTESL